MSSMIAVSVVYALPQKQALRRVTLKQGSSAEAAIRASGLIAEFPDIDLATNPIAIYGKLARRDLALRDGDRVEILRPLLADPKESRRVRAAKRRAERK